MASAGKNFGDLMAFRMNAPLETAAIGRVKELKATQQSINMCRDVLESMRTGIEWKHECARQHNNQYRWFFFAGYNEIKI